jgi:hypothetical protein
MEVVQQPDLQPVAEGETIMPCNASDPVLEAKPESNKIVEPAESEVQEVSVDMTGVTATEEVKLSDEPATIEPDVPEIKSEEAKPVEEPQPAAESVSEPVKEVHVPPGKSQVK